MTKLKCGKIEKNFEEHFFDEKNSFKIISCPCGQLFFPHPNPLPIKKIKNKSFCQKWDLNPRPQKRTAT
jgi:hypothetical protein